MNVNDLITDTKSASRKIKDITDTEPTLYRAPYGEYDDTVITTVEGMGLTVIQWDVDSLDWKKPDPSAITKKVVNSVKSGSIVLFHNDLENTTEALPQILEQLSQKGYEFVPVSELIYTENYTIDPNGMQIPIVQSNTEITPENVDEVMAQYSEQLHSAGVSDEQMALAAQAVKSGAEIPDEVYEALADYAMSNGITPASLIPDTAEAPDTMDSESSGAETESGIVK
jgi:predicted xylanase/chitin deacetylase